MARAKARSSTQAPAPEPGAPAAPPLADQMRRESAESHQALEAFGLTPESYASLTAQAAELEKVLRDSGVGHAADRLRRLSGIVAAALEHAPSDLNARGRAYLALLDSILMQSLATEAPSPKWLNRLNEESRRMDAGHDAASLALLTVAGMCAEIGAKVTPPPEGPIPIEWQGWRFGLVATQAPDAASIVPRVADAVGALRAARMPGLVVIDLAQPVCPEQRPLRASHPDAGAAELRARLDRLLQDARPGLVEACDRDHTLGVIGTAFLALQLVTSDQMAFITAYRFMSLLEPSDPREIKLTTFRERFGDL